MRVREIMNSRVHRADPEEPAEAAWLRMRRHRIRHLIVDEDGRMIGVLSQRDLGGPHGATVRRGRTVRELMAAPPVVAQPTTTLRQAANLMRGRTVGSLPVVDGGEVVGIITATDVLDELGRGSTRPAVQAQRQSMRSPPASARRALASRQSKRRPARAKSSAAQAVQEGAVGLPPSPSHRRDTHGHARIRTPDSPTRAPLAAATARADKRAGAPRSPADIPAYIRAPDPRVTPEDRAYLRRKLGRRLGRTAADVQRASVRLEDINGPRGGVDWHCRIKVVLRGLPSVVVAAREASIQTAMDRALAMAGSGVRRALQRRRTVQGGHRQR